MHTIKWTFSIIYDFFLYIGPKAVWTNRKLLIYLHTLFELCIKGSFISPSIHPAWYDTNDTSTQTVMNGTNRLYSSYPNSSGSNRMIIKQVLWRPFCVCELWYTHTPELWLYLKPGAHAYLIVIGYCNYSGLACRLIQPSPPVPSPDKPSPAGAQPFTCLSSNVAAQPINYFYYQFMS